jgi:Flp pilus assembly protein TadD
MNPTARRAAGAVLAALVTAGCGHAPRESGSPPSGRALYFVGLDGADWALLDGYMARGVMPNLASLVAEGQAGVLTTIQPPLSPLVWTSMMTGVSPLEHRVLDFTRFRPGTSTKEPITSDERRVPALWTIASARGLTVGVFGLWATWPAEPVRGVIVSDRLFSFQHAERDAPAGVVFPPERERGARATLAETEAAIDLAAMRSYLPWLDDAGYRRARDLSDAYTEPVGALRRILVETRVYDRLAAEWEAESRPALSILYIQGTDAVGHVFAPFVPPASPDVAAGDEGRFGGVAETYFREIDALLGRWRDRARERGAVLMVASDHGFFWGEGRPTRLASAAAATAGRWHREEGIYVLWGDGVARADGRRGRGSILQVAATALAVLGLPRGAGFAEPALPGAPVEAASEADYGATWRPASVASHGASPDDDEAFARLRALGYVGSGAPAEAPAEAAASQSTRTAASWNNEGLILRSAGRSAEARAAFERAIAIDPASPSARWNLSELLEAEGEDPDHSDALLLEALDRGLPDGARHAVERAILRRRSRSLDAALSLTQRAARSAPLEPDLWLYLGRLLLEAGRCEEALHATSRAEALGRTSAALLAASGLARACLGDADGASRDLRRSLLLDPDQPAIRRALEGTSHAP